MQYILIFLILGCSILLAYLMNIPLKNKHDLLVVIESVFEDYFYYEGNSAKRFPFIYYIKRHNADANNVYAKTIMDNFTELTSRFRSYNSINDLFDTKRSTNQFKAEEEKKLLDKMLIIIKYTFKTKEDFEERYNEYKELSQAQVTQYKSSMKVNYILTIAIAMVAIILII